MSIDWDALVIGPCMGTFGEAVRYHPADGDPVNITGVFDEAYRELTPLGHGGLIDTEGFSNGLPSITTVMPVLGIQLSQFLACQPDQGDALVLRGTTYVVKEVRPDGHGGAKLLLNEAPGRL